MSNVSVQQQILIQKPLSEVYPHLLDPMLLPVWNPFVLEARPLGAEAGGPASPYFLRMRVGWREFSLNLNLIRREEGGPLGAIELHGRGDRFKVIERYRLHEEKPGESVRLDYELTLRVPRRPAGLLAPLLRRYAERVLDHLKKGLEGAPSRWESSPWQKLSDRLLIPAIFGLSRSGYAWQKSRWTAVLRPLEGKRILITGATSELGMAAARGLARRGAELILVARHEKKLRHLSELIQAESGQKPRLEFANLSLMREVLALSRKLRDEGRPLHVLINNPSKLPTRRIITSEGLELAFANGLLGPFLLGEELRPVLELGQPARLIQVTSAALYAQALHPEDLESEKADYGPLRVYGRLRRALLDLGEVWARRWSAESIAVHNVCPGLVQRLGPLPGLPENWSAALGDFLRSPEQGVDTLIWLAAAPEIQGTSGLFWFDRRPRPTALVPGTRSRPERQEELYQKLLGYAARFQDQS